MLQVENLKKSFGKVQAVRGISFSVKKGGVVGLLGPNGAGKTTTMRLVTGFLAADTGTVSVQGTPMHPEAEATKKMIGYLPENAPLYFDMEVVEFLEYVAALRQETNSLNGGSVREVIHLCGLQSVVGRPVGKLSRGYKQRVGLAQALVHRPPLLILDEPTTGLDPHQIQEIRQLILELGKERTVILSTHIMQEVQAVCGRALIISKGMLVGDGTLEELLRSKKGGGRYVATIKAPEAEIKKSMRGLPGLSVEEWRGANGSGQQIVFRAADQKEHGEEIFQWVVDHNWVLSELRCEKSTLEDVFLELTK